MAFRVLPPSIRRLQLHNRFRLTALSLAIAVPLGTGLPVWAHHAPDHVTTTQTLVGPVQELTLKNGLKVILKEDHSAPVVTWVVFYRVGSRNEVPGTTGSTHLLEHMLFKGTKTLGKGQIANLLGRNGADYNASTWTDWTNYYETYSSDKLELGLMVEASRMRDATIPDDERQSEMTVVRNELERNESNPSRMLYQEVTAAAFKAHPYHHPVIGWRSDVEGVQTSALKQFYDTFYHPNNAVAVLVGDFRSPDAIRLIREYFERLPAGPTPPQVYTKEEVQLGERRVVLNRRGETNLVMMAFHIPGVQSPDLASLLVTDTILSSGVTDRLHQALVETQLATSVGAWTSVQRDPSLFWVSATIRPGVSHEAVETALWAELEKLKNQPVTAKELLKAKNQAEANTIYGNDGTSGLAHALGSFAAIDHWKRGFDLLEEMKKVEAKDVQRVAQAYFTRDNRTIGWYVATPDGPVPPAPQNSGNGKAVSNNQAVVPAPLQPFEQRPVKRPQLTKPVRQVLKNGMTVLVLENPSSQTLVVDGFVRAGDFLNPVGKTGLASLVADMLDKGTTKRTKLQLAGDLEEVAASAGFSGGSEVVSIEARCLPKDRQRVFQALADMLKQPSFPEDELKKLKANWIAFIKQREDQPGARAWRALTQAIFPKGHPYYEWDPQDRMTQLEATSVEDLKAFHQRYYGPNTTTLVVVGNVKAPDVVQSIDKAFAGWKPAEKVPFNIPDVPFSTAERVVIPMMDQTNVSVYWGHAGKVRRSSPNYLAATLANYVLGGSALTGRLGVKLRDEMGLTYGTGSSFSAGMGAGPWRASITVHPANAETAIRALQEQVQRFVEQGMTLEELNAAKSAFIGSQAVGLATNGGLADSLANVELYQLGLDYWERFPQMVQQHTLDQVNLAAKELIQPANAHLVIAGPMKP